MNLTNIDWIIIAAFFIVSLGIGLAVSFRAGKSASEFFLSGRRMPWWLLGVSLVATTFSADTPNLVTELVRKNGVAGNWAWWAFLLTGMLTVFVYAKLWRRSEALTDLEFYEMRYSGKEAAFLRGFRALYLGVFFNVMIMATVCLAAIKIGGVMLGLTPPQTIIIASIVTIVYSTIGGFKGVLWTDFFQFFLAMAGAIWAAVEILNMESIGGLEKLMTHPAVADKLSVFPDFSNAKEYVPLLLVPLAVQWWSVWYPGAEPGGGGYVAQRMLSAKDEKNAIGATLLFNIMHYALRPWPWIIVALGSLIVYPTLADIQSAFPHIPVDQINHDLAYSAMLTHLPMGLKGLIVASLIAAFMSTISTHLNWGSSYVVNDFYARFINPRATDKQQVLVGRFSTVILMVLAAIIALYLKSAKAGFDLLLQIGAGTGLIFILRWFWWRISAYTEIAGMVISFVVSLTFIFLKQNNLIDWEDHEVLIISVAITTIGWLIVTFVAPTTDAETLKKFCAKIKPYGSGWKKYSDGTTLGASNLPMEILCMAMGCIAVYSALFATGFIIYSNYPLAISCIASAAVSTVILFYSWKKIR